MQKYPILLLFLVATVSCERMKTISKDLESSHIDINCKNWDQQKATCIQCYDGCTKWQNICVKIVQYCAQWNDSGNCTSCQTGYGDSHQKSINGSCPKQSTPTTQNTQTQKNQTHQNQTQTSAPNGQKQAPNGQTSAPNGQVQNKTKKQSSKKKSSSLRSERNQPQLPLVDINCQCHTEDRQCIYCFNGYYLDFNATCQQLPENCTSANENGECTSCVRRFVLENGICLQQECDLALCTFFNEDQTECTACSFRSYLMNGCCVQVNGFCSAWIQETGECTACYQGYTIDPENNKQCIPTSG